MSKKKLTFAASLVVVALGGVMHLFGWDRAAGLSFLGLAMVALILFREQQLLERQFKKTGRIAAEARDAVKALRGLNSWYGKQLLDYGNSTFKRVKALYDRVLPSSLDTSPLDNSLVGSQLDYQDMSGADDSRAGRAAAPAVKNPGVDESLKEMLDPSRKVTVAGAFEQNLTEGLDTVDCHLKPGLVLPLLHGSRPDVVILDEAYLGKGQWHGVFSASGTSQMKELLAGIELCNRKEIPVFILKQHASIDIHSYSLRDARVNILPLKEAAISQAHGANLTPLLQQIQKIANERESK